MTTRRKLDQHQAPGHGDDASVEHAARPGQPRTSQPAPADRQRAESGRVGRASASPSEPASRIEDSRRRGGRANAPIANPGRGRSGHDQDRDDRELDSDRNAERIDDLPVQQTEPNPTPADSTGTDTQTSDRTGNEERTGVDARRRGWFWHWNNVVTQYAPLIGLKGVGLLNSYTVWTDRRDESPHRGYAFPSQQSEADFYGEERAELITINKILVALDLIEIRKEMLTRVDDRGRRWRVPHNLYRVKDRPDGVDLRAEDVMRVVILARQDEAVFRHVRRVFSERFRPIDGDNVWHAILSELRSDPTWRELQDRTRAIEARASARTRAGHQSRTSASAAKSEAAQNSASAPVVDAALDDPRSDNALLPNTQQSVAEPISRTTSVASNNTGSHRPIETVVEPTNSGLAGDVAGANTGAASFSPTSVAAVSNGRKPVVGPGNTTYDQADLTTTTTTSALPKNEPTDDLSPGEASGGGQSSLGSSDGATTSTTSVNGDRDDDQRADGRSVRRGTEQADAPDDASATDRHAEQPHASEPNQSRVLGAIDEGVERKRDRRMVSGGTTTDQQVATRIEGNGDERRTAGARTSGGTRERSLADPAAGGPLVDSGPLVISTFEAANDRRVTPLERHLLAELERDADPAARAAGSTGAEWLVAAMREAVASGSAFVAPKRIREIIARWSANPRHAPSSPAARMSPASDEPSQDTPPANPADGGTIDVRLPGGVSGSAIWATVLDDLARALDRDAYDRLLADSRITRYWRGAVEIHAGSRASADKLSNEYRGLVERHLNSRLRRPVSVRFMSDPVDAVAVDAPAEPAHESPPDAPQPLVLAEAEVGTGRQVWQSLLGDLARVVPPADVDRLAGVIVLGQDAGGAILLGTPSPLARRLLDVRYRADVESSLAALLGQPSPIRVLAPADWSITPRQ